MLLSITISHGLCHLEAPARSPHSVALKLVPCLISQGEAAEEAALHTCSSVVGNIEMIDRPTLCSGVGPHSRAPNTSDSQELLPSRPASSPALRGHRASPGPSHSAVPLLPSLQRGTPSSSHYHAKSHTPTVCQLTIQLPGKA